MGRTKCGAPLPCGLTDSLIAVRMVLGRERNLSQANTRRPSPLCGGGWPLRQQGSGEGNPGSGGGATGLTGEVLFCTVAPLSRPGLTAGPPSPAEGGG
ncbi:hypothetical protein FV228_31460, partial [Methylobacterium sp. WL18]